MIIVPVKEGDNIERALKKFKRKTEKTVVIKELRTRQAFQKPSITNDEGCLCAAAPQPRGVIPLDAIIGQEPTKLLVPVIFLA